jgi:hypothetical protein
MLKLGPEIHRTQRVRALQSLNALIISLRTLFRLMNRNAGSA